MRRLIYIPNIHPLDNLLESGKSLLLTEPKVMEVADTASERVWRVIKQSLNNLKLDLRGIKVFAEGVCSPEQVETLRLISREGIAGLPGQQQAPIVTTYDKFLINLLKNGAEIQPTEEGSLYAYQIFVLERIVAIYHEIEASGDPESTFDRLKDEVLALRQIFNHTAERRDCFIAERIRKTLKDGETGILIIGAQHGVQKFLDGDIEVEPISQDLLREIERGLELSERELSQVSDVWGRNRREQFN